MSYTYLYEQFKYNHLIIDIDDHENSGYRCISVHIDKKRLGGGGDLSHWISFVVVVFNRGFLFILGLSRLWVI